MADVILLTGGARSGKSAQAETYAKEFGGNQVLYVATAAVCDEEMEERVRKHRAQRPAPWKTLEQFWEFESLEKNSDFLEAKVVLVDCLGFMLNNILYYCGIDWETCTLEEMAEAEKRMLHEVDILVATCRAHGKGLIGVTNEVGMGLVPEQRSGRYYRDILGRANGHFAQLADQVIFMVAGIPMQVK